MSIKIYNEEKQKWEVHASSMASATNVLDVGNKYKTKSKNVEACLSELKDDMMEANKAIKYVFDHGGNGTGGGGGGSLLPLLKIIGPKELVVTSDQIITIEYSFTSNNRGNGVIQLNGGGSVEEKEIAQGKVYSWTLGPFKKGKHNISLNVRDAQGFWSGAELIVVYSGALQLIDNFDHDKSFIPGDIVEIPYTLEAASNSPVSVTRIFNGKKEVISESPGDKEWRIELPRVKGIYKASIQASGNDLESNILKYDLIAADSDTLYMTSSFPVSPEIINVKLNQNLVIDYTNSMLGQTYYDSYIYIDEMSEDSYIEKVRSVNGRNNAIIGDRLPLGEHNIRIKTVTLDGQYSEKLDFTVNVTSTNFVPYPDIKEGLIAHFEATGNMNNSETRDKWRNRVPGSNISCTLHNFNYSSNGWIQVDKGSDLPTCGSLFERKNNEKNKQETVLRCSGKTYAIIDYAPFINGIGRGKGFTFEIVYRTENTGDPKAKVVSCKNSPENTKGFDIDTHYANLRTIYAEQALVPFNENEWTRMSFVVSRPQEKVMIYCNGILSGFADMKSVFGDGDGLKHPNKIILGAALADVTGTYTDFSNCDIRTVRIYDRGLTSSEIVSNYIADIKDEEEQMYIRELNGLEKGFENSIPTVNIINADAIEHSDAELACVIDYTDTRNPDKTRLFQTCTIKWQGTSSLEYPVKNYTIQIKEEGRDYYGWTPKDEWRPESRWTLKANYMDSSQSNNVGAAKFIHEFFKHNMYPIQRENEGSRTNVDGFPIRLMISGVFKGIYTFNIDRYSYNNYGFAKYDTNGSNIKNPNVVSYEFNVNNSPVFELDYSDPVKEERAWNETVRYHLKHRYNGKTDAPTEQITVGSEVTEVLFNRSSHKELMDLLKWMSSFKDTPEERKQWVQELDDHFSIPHLIDYWLIAMMFGMIDNLGKNMVLTTYGKTIDSEGNQLTIWYPTFYDCDSILGLDNVGANVVSPGAEMHNQYVTAESRLWKWMIDDPEIWDKIKLRYMNLRSNVVNDKKQPLFSMENMMTYIGGHVSDTIGHKYYNDDFEYKYLDAVKESHRYMCQGSRRSYIERWLRERLVFLDSMFGFGDYEQKLLTMRSNITGPVKLEIKTYSPQKTGVLFQAGSEYVIRTTSKNQSTTFEFNLVNGENNEIKIKGADNIMEIKGLEDLNLSVLKIADARRLTNIELPRNKRLRELVIGNNKYLRIIDVSDSTKLGGQFDSGEENPNRMINLSQCENLRILRCQRTSLEGVTFPEHGGVLEELDCSETNIGIFKMPGQEYLKHINLASCPRLESVVVSKCDGLESISVPRSALRTFNVVECRKLNEVDVSFTNQLSSFNIDQCPEVLKLKMEAVSNRDIETLNISSLLKLEELDIRSSSIKHIVFGKYPDGTNFNKLKKLRCDQSAIQTIRYRLYDSVPSYLDLKGLNLEQLSFNSCKNVKDIKNIKLITSSGSYAFNECTNLVSVSGELTFSGSMSRTFYNCIALRTLPTGNSTGNRLDLSGVSSMNETFENCDSIDLNFAKMIMSKVSSNLTSTYRLFHRCDNIVTNDSTPLPRDFFSRATGLTSISEMFRSCSKMAGGLDENILSPMTKLTNCYYAFGGTKITGGLKGAPLSVNFFKNNKELLTTQWMFAGADVKAVPSNDLFAYNSKLDDVYGMFTGCYNMTGQIPEDIFRNNSNLKRIGPFFHDCRNVSGKIPRKFFDTRRGADNALTDVNLVFYNTKISGEIPKYRSSSDKGLFDYSPLLSDVSGVFHSCSQVTGVIPEDIFKYNRRLTKVARTFAYCTGLGSSADDNFVIPTNLLKEKTSLTSTEGLFLGCTHLQGTIPEGFLDDCTLITDVSNMFNGCGKLVGQIPARDSIWVDVPIDPERPELGTIKEEIVKKYGLFDKCKVLSSAASVFRGCERLNSFIPETLFISGSQITNLNEFFYACRSLMGGVPKDLFKKTPLLQSTRYMFANCDKIREPFIDLEDEDHKWIIPRELFANNPYLTDVTGMFDMSAWGTNMYGYLPPELFNIATKLKNVDRMFHYNRGVKGHIDGNLFRFNTDLRTASYFCSHTNAESLGSSLFSTCKKIDDLSNAFNNSTNLTGRTFDYRSLASVTKKGNCFGHCTKLDNYAEAKADGWAD